MIKVKLYNTSPTKDIWYGCYTNGTTVTGSRIDETYKLCTLTREARLTLEKEFGTTDLLGKTVYAELTKDIRTKTNKYKGEEFYRITRATPVETVQPVDIFNARATPSMCYTLDVKIGPYSTVITATPENIDEIETELLTFVMNSMKDEAVPSHIRKVLQIVDDLKHKLNQLKHATNKSVSSIPIEW